MTHFVVNVRYPEDFMLRKIIALCLLAVLPLGTLTACGGNETSQDDTNTNAPVQDGVENEGQGEDDDQDD